MIGVVGEAFSGKFFTVFGGAETEGDMRGALERTAEELLETAKELDGKETRCKVLARFGYVSKSKIVLDSPFKKLTTASAFIDEVM